jgi:hypothetical protein
MGRDHLEDPGIDGRIILQWILRKQGRSMKIAFTGLRIAGSCEHSNKPSGSIKRQGVFG